MKDLLDLPMRLKYLHRGNVVDAGPVRFNEKWYDAWLHHFTSQNMDIIFFIVVDSTDVFEKEFNFNTVVIRAGNSGLYHSYSPECPEGCHGQLDDCTYKVEGDRHG